jgi:hypothetical protein
VDSYLLLDYITQSNPCQATQISLILSLWIQERKRKVPKEKERKRGIV